MKEEMSGESIDHAARHKAEIWKQAFLMYATQNYNTSLQCNASSMFTSSALQNSVKRLVSLSQNAGPPSTRLSSSCV